MKTLAAGVIALTLFGAAVAPAVAQPKPLQSPTNRARVFAEPG